MKSGAAKLANRTTAPRSRIAAPAQGRADALSPVATEKRVADANATNMEDNARVTAKPVANSGPSRMNKRINVGVATKRTAVPVQRSSLVKRQTKKVLSLTG